MHFHCQKKIPKSKTDVVFFYKHIYNKCQIFNSSKAHEMLSGGSESLRLARHRKLPGDTCLTTSCCRLIFPATAQLIGKLAVAWHCWQKHDTELCFSLPAAVTVSLLNVATNDIMQCTLVMLVSGDLPFWFNIFFFFFWQTSVFLVGKSGSVGQ